MLFRQAERGEDAGRRHEKTAGDAEALRDEIHALFEAMRRHTVAVQRLSELHDEHDTRIATGVIVGGNLCV